MIVKVSADNDFISATASINKTETIEIVAQDNEAVITDMPLAITDSEYQGPAKYHKQGADSNAGAMYLVCEMLALHEETMHYGTAIKTELNKYPLI